MKKDSNVKSVETKESLEQIGKRLRKEQRDAKIKAFFKNKLSVCGLVIVIFMLLVAIFAPVLAGYGPNEMVVKDRLMAPCKNHWFGTDSLGRDVFTEVVYGARISLLVGFVVSVVSAVVGMIIGLYASYNKVLDNILMRICDGMKAIPNILLAICLMASLGASLRNVLISLTIVCTPGIARVARSAALVVREQTYIEAMDCLGAKPNRILWKHVAPNVLSPVIVQLTFNFATAILAEASLSFLGAGVPASVPSWGSILNEGMANIYVAWWMIIFPGIFTALTVLGLNLLGDGLRDFLDPLTN